MKVRKKLIEVALPLEAINVASAREKSIRHGHPSTLHLWWARRPLAAARAVIFAQMVDDPGSWPELFPTAQKQEKERQRLFRIIEELVLWENTTNERVLQQARDEIWASWRRACAEWADHPRARELFDRHKLPAFHDPFAGGGSLPLEAQRLGLEAYASDLNPVAVLICKAMIEIPPRFAGKPPVNPEARRVLLGAQASRLQLGDDPWRSRGYLPHFDRPGLLQAITFRLADSLPQSFLDRCEQELASLPVDRRQTEREKRIAAWLDQAAGECHLRVPRIAELVQNALLHFDGERYRLLAWCVMPNHVHVLIETAHGHPLDQVLHSWKSFTAKEANRVLGRTGTFWQTEYHDRFIRDDAHFANAVKYIEGNPVEAGLVESAGEWRWSSAGKVGRGAGGTPALPAYCGAKGLAEDVRYYGQWMRDEAEKRIGHLYPKIEVTAAMVAGSAGVSPARPDLRRYLGQKLTVIAWLWARTVKSPNPAFASVDVPLVSTFMLSTKAGKEAYVEPVIAGSAGVSPAYRFEVRTRNAGGTPALPAEARNGTKLSRGSFRCLLSNVPIRYEYIDDEANGGRMGERLMAIVAEGKRCRIYLSPTPEHEAIARQAQPTFKPDAPSRGTWASNAQGRRYGFRTFGDYFTPRQLVTLTTFSDLVQEARERVKRDALAAGLPDDPALLEAGGSGGTAYADAVALYLAFITGKLTESHSTLCTWSAAPKNELVVSTFRRQALPMTWDYGEANPFADSSGSVAKVGEAVARVVMMALSGIAPGLVQQADAAVQAWTCGKVVSTDPPYYDNVGYADLSDFFYVWLRKSLQPIFPELFATVAVPKAEELVATPYRHGSKERAEAFFLNGMTQAMRRLAEQTHPAFPVTIYYAFKQAESDDAAGTSSTGWEAFLDAVIRAGFGITGTWPMRTERDARSIGIGTNALASSIVLVCRPRPADAPTATRREFVTALKAELPVALRTLQGLGARASGPHAGGTPAFPGIAPVALRTLQGLGARASGPHAGGTPAFPGIAPVALRTLQGLGARASGPHAGGTPAFPGIAPVALRTLQGLGARASGPHAGGTPALPGIAPVDLAQAAIGPGMAVYTRYARVLDATGQALSVRDALALINQTLDEALAEQEGDFDADTRWALAWFEQVGFAEGDYGLAETLSKAKNTSVSGMVEAGILASHGGKARLLRPAELPPGWDPATDTRLTMWEIVHHLIRVLESGGEGAAAGLVATLGSKAEVARELAYRLYTLCERRKRAPEALAYNALVQSFPEITRLSREGSTPGPVQTIMFDEE